MDRNYKDVAIPYASFLGGLLITWFFYRLQTADSMAVENRVMTGLNALCQVQCSILVNSFMVTDPAIDGMGACARMAVV